MLKHNMGTFNLKGVFSRVFVVPARAGYVLTDPWPG